ncbi:hypothetical protein A1O3_02794 [Capronia epimyces CBS 606.96]|uniref:Uncharacterized protein n=1 Tax=Capronia epimyces CBS 606.96 TaxID=1182542 RepID=W9YA38_9EURO|nr:uncharacterized protein A1O3_02794 [Capronia epimyces CBS 606.96]EXJ89727.1 hypothetical protein A1O3_02794 [Capronia epimyces CBS 606.96]
MSRGTEPLAGDMHLEPGSSNPIVVINGVSYNATTLTFWNYTAYANGTLSNGSNCFLAFDTYKPILLSPNGTFINATSCYQPIHAIGPRGITGLAFGSLFAVSVLLSTINLRKHGRAYLPRGKRWRPIGRRWSWYWTIIVAACGLLSCFTAIDVDRDHVVNTPMVLQCFFLTLMVPALLACVWESVRSWSSAQHRRLHDADAFSLAPDDFRARVGFYLPLIFYAFDWLVFFLAAPRSWSFVQKQRSLSQTLESAKPTALDARFKAASVLAIVCLGCIVFRLNFSSRIYHLRIPHTIHLVASLLAVRIAYGIIGSFVWILSPYRLEVSIGWLYGLGYAPTLLVLFLLNLRGYQEENEDILLIAARAQRGDGLEDDSHLTHQGDRDQGRQGKHPSWWLKPRNPTLSPTNVFKTSGSKLRHDVDDSTSRGYFDHGDPSDESGQYWWQRRKQGEEDARLRRSKSSAVHARPRWPSADYDNDHASTSSRWTEREAPTPLHTDDGDSVETGSNKSVHSIYDRSRGKTSEPSSSTLSLQSRPQVVRSMLDV